MTRKRILWLCSWYPNRTDPFDGDFVQRHARAAALQHDIHVIRVIADPDLPPGKTDIQVIQHTGLTEQLIYIGKKNSLPGRYFFYRRWNHQFRKAIQDYINTYGKPDWVHVHVPYPAGRMALWVKQKYAVPFVVTEHWTIYQPGSTISYQQQPARLRKLVYRVMKESSLFLPVSADLGQRVNHLVTPVLCTVIPNVVDTDLFFYQDRGSVVDPVFRFIHVSGMNAQKNPQGLLRAFSAAFREDPQIRLLMLGNRDDSLHRFSDTLGLPAGTIRFGGEVNYPEVAVQMQKADALVLFSNMENAPCVISEALCCGVPVIATQTGGIPEMINATNGLLVEPGDETAMKNALLDLKENRHRYNRALIASDAKRIYQYEIVSAAFSAVYNIPVS